MAVDTIEKAIIARLTGYAGLSALIGTRVYPGYLPQGVAKPAAYYEEESTERLSTDDGDGTYRESDFSITTVADSYASAKAVSKQVEDALARWVQPSRVGPPGYGCSWNQDGSNSYATWDQSADSYTKGYYTDPSADSYTLHEELTIGVIETLVSSDGTMPVEETLEWIAVTKIKIQYFAQ